MGACMSTASPASFNWAAAPRVSTPDGVKAAKSALLEVIKTHKCGPIFLRLAWHDAGTFDKVRARGMWGACGGGRDRLGRKTTIGGPRRRGGVSAIMVAVGAAQAKP